MYLMRVAYIAALLALTPQRPSVGVVWSNCVFDMDGTVSQIKLNTGETADMSSFASRASSIHVTESFSIENNLIRRVEMIGTGVPYHFNSSWGPVLSGK